MFKIFCHGPSNTISLTFFVEYIIILCGGIFILFARIIIPLVPGILFCAFRLSFHLLALRNCAIRLISRALRLLYCSYGLSSYAPRLLNCANRLVMDSFHIVSAHAPNCLVPRYLREIRREGATFIWLPYITL